MQSTTGYKKDWMRKAIGSLKLKRREYDSEKRTAAAAMRIGG